MQLKWLAEFMNRALPEAKAEAREDWLALTFPKEGVRAQWPVAFVRGAQDLIESGHGETPPDELFVIEEPNVEFMKWARHARASAMNTATGEILLHAPGLHVEISGARPRGSVGDSKRNPFAGKGLAVSTQLLLEPDRVWTVGDLATAAEVSEPHASRVVTALESESLIERQDGEIRPILDPLFLAVARSWPRPIAYFEGRVPDYEATQGRGRLEFSVGGQPAYTRYGVVTMALPRVYVRSRQLLRRVALLAGAFETSAAHAEWEAVICAVPFLPGLVPRIVAALELGGDPRGEELLATSGLVPWRHR